MNPEQIEAHRQKLMARRESLLGQVADADKNTRERDTEALQDPADLAASSYNKELSLSMSSKDRELLGQIEEALVRISAGEYGICVNCGEPVPEKRLAAVPWARYCLKCQDLAERGLLDEAEG